MAGTRSSARQAANNAAKTTNSDQPTSAKPAVGDKRQSDDEIPAPKRGRKGQSKQMTIEEAMPDAEGDPSGADVNKSGKTSNDKEKGQRTIQETMPDTEMKDNGTKESKAGDDNEEDGPSGGNDAETRNDKPQTDVGAGNKEETDNQVNASAVIEDPEREQALPSTILEKGIIYFFFRSRVGIEDPEGVRDIARTYMVLRPLPLGAKLGEGSVEDTSNNRLLALPKKVLPTSHRDRFLVFVEKANTTIKELKDNVLCGAEYTTRTVGTRHTNAVTPVGEGVYAVTTTGRESHLSYILTVPSKIDEVQKELGLRSRASFVVSVKNPEVRGPPNASLPNPAKYDKEILDEFRNRSWMPLQPKLLDYDNTQILFIGEQTDDISKATEPSPKDQKNDKETPLEEMEKLEHEDEIRVTHLKGDDPIFADLGLSSEEYSKLQTTW